MALVALAILAATAVGMAAEWRYGAGAQRFARRLIDFIVWALVPFVVFFLMARLQLGGGVGFGLLLGFVELGALGWLAYQLGTRLLHLDRPAVGTLICLVILANTGYLGIPLTTALLGYDALPPAIAWDTIVSQTMLYTAGFGVGAAFGTTAGQGVSERVRAFFTRNPVLYALIAGLLVPDTLAPQALVDVAESLAVYVLPPLGFFLVGVNLMAERVHGEATLPPPMSEPVALAVALRLLVAPALLAGLSALTIAVPRSYLVQAAMPSGINTLIVAHLYGLNVRVAASAIVWTTAFAITAAVALSFVI